MNMRPRVPREGHVASPSTPLLPAGCRGARAAETKPLKRMERFKAKGFVIGSWCPPSPSEANYRAYMDAGFNLVMTERSYQNPDKEFEIAEKLGLWVLIDTYMKNETPWGGMELDPPPDEPLHHRARPAELKWLLERYGQSPVLAGVLLGDDCGLEDHMIENAEYMLKVAPGVFPWYSINLDRERQTRAPIPMLSTQNYVFVIRKDEPEPVKRKAYCDQIERDRQWVNGHNMALWPWIICQPEASPSEVRFQVYSSIAYGAQGLWYYFFRGNVWDTAKRKPGPKHAVVRECNRYVAAIGQRLIGRRSIGVFHSTDAEQANGEAGSAAANRGGRGPGKVHLGFRLGDLTPEFRSEHGIPENVGLRISDVNRQLSAGKAGVQHGDILIAFDGQTIVSWPQFMELLRGHSAGDKVLLTVHRRPKGRVDMRVVLDAVEEVNPLTPGKDKFIRSMSDHVLAGMLVPEDKMDIPGAGPDSVMVVDKRTVKPGEPEPGEREVYVEFGPEVGSISVFTSGTTKTRTRGCRITLSLKPGAGVLLEVKPQGLPTTT